jgi:hypothetical protein
VFGNDVFRRARLFFIRAAMTCSPTTTTTRRLDMWTRARDDIRDFTHLSTQQLHQLAARLRHVEADLAQRIADRAVTRTAGNDAGSARDLVRQRLALLLEKQRRERKAVEEELHARLDGGAASARRRRGKAARPGALAWPWAGHAQTPLSRKRATV